jgi:hypothetical protein
MRWLKAGIASALLLAAATAVQAEKVVYSADWDGDGARDICIMNEDGSGQSLVITNGNERP